MTLEQILNEVGVNTAPFNHALIALIILGIILLVIGVLIPMPKDPCAECSYKKCKR